MCHLCYQVRLMLTLAPIACVLAAIGLSSILTRFSGVIKEHKLFSNTVAAQKGDAFPYLSLLFSSLFLIDFIMTPFPYLSLLFSSLFLIDFIMTPFPYLSLLFSSLFLIDFIMTPFLSLPSFFPIPSSYFVYLTITPLA